MHGVMKNVYPAIIGWPPFSPYGTIRKRPFWESDVEGSRHILARCRGATVAPAQSLGDQVTTGTISARFVGLAVRSWPVPHALTGNVTVIRKGRGLARVFETGIATARIVGDINP